MTQAVQDTGLDTLIKDIDTYDPSKVSDQVLLDDHRICHAWASSIISGKDFKYTYDQVKTLHDAIAQEILKRGFEHNTPLSEKPDIAKSEIPILAKEPTSKPVREIRHDDIAKMTENQLKLWLRILPNLFHMTSEQKIKRGFSVEDIVNLYIMITDELTARGIKFDIPDQDLEDSANKLKDKGRNNEVSENISETDPLPKHPYPLQCEECFDMFKDFEMDNFILIVGGLPERGTSDNDIDVLIRQNFRDERMEEAILSHLPREIATRVQFIYARSGPHDKYVQLYKLKFEKVKDYQLKEIGIDDQLD